MQLSLLLVRVMALVTSGYSGWEPWAHWHSFLIATLEASPWFPCSQSLFGARLDHFRGLLRYCTTQCTLTYPPSQPHLFCLRSPKTWITIPLNVMPVHARWWSWVILSVVVHGYFVSFHSTLELAVFSSGFFFRARIIWLFIFVATVSGH